jgi:uncharacterized protein (DUF58 family)
LGVAAVNTGNNLVYLVVSALLGFMGISGIFGKNNLSGVKVQVEFPEDIYAKTECPAIVTLVNKKRFFPVFLMKLKIGGDTVFFPFVDGRSSSTRHLNVTFPRRGRHKIADLHIFSVFPFNFFTRYRKLNTLPPIVVFPRPKRSELLFPYNRNRRWTGEIDSDRAGYESDIVSIREYAYGDPLKYVNWKATARTGQLKTKELSSPVYEPVVIDFDEVPIKDLEERISSIAYTIIQCHRENRPIGMRMDGRVFAPGSSHRHRSVLLRELALYGSD